MEARNNVKEHPWHPISASHRQFMELHTHNRLGQFLRFMMFLFIGTSLWAQNDSIKLKNNDLLVGEIKTLSKSVLTLKTSYSDKDFKIDFDDVVSISTSKLCVIQLTNNTRITGRMKSLSPNKARIIDNDGVSFEVAIRDIGSAMYLPTSLVNVNANE